MDMSKIISSYEAAKLMKDGDTLAMSAFAGGTGFPEEICMNIEKVFQESGHPKDLTLMFASGNGDSGKSDFGLDHFAYPEMVKLIIGGHIGLAKKLSGLVNENKIAAYNLPQGVVTHLFRAIAGGRMGVFTHVGLGTFADPRVEGGKMNKAATEDIVEYHNISSVEQLLYKSRPIHVGLIRGTTADEKVAGCGVGTVTRVQVIGNGLSGGQVAYCGGISVHLQGIGIRQDRFDGVFHFLRRGNGRVAQGVVIDILPADDGGTGVAILKQIPDTGAVGAQGVGFLIQHNGFLLLQIQGLSGMIGLGFIGHGANGLSIDTVFGVVAKKVYITYNVILFLFHLLHDRHCGDHIVHRPVGIDNLAGEAVLFDGIA